MYTFVMAYAVYRLKVNKVHCSLLQNKKAPDATLHSLDGKEEVSLLSLAHSGRPLVVLMGSLT